MNSLLRKIPALLAVLITLCGIHEAQARRWPVAVAMRMAKTGDFNASDSAQLLADIPEEWKKENRKLVREIRDGLRGRGARKRDIVIEEKGGDEGMLDLGGDEGEEDLDEKNDTEYGPTKDMPKLKDLMEKKEIKLDEEEQKRENNKLKLTLEEALIVKRIEGNFEDNLKRMYINLSVDTWKPKVDKTTKVMSLDPKDFDKALNPLVSAQNNFFDALLSIERKEKTDPDYLMTVYVKELINVAGGNETLINQCRLVAQLINKLARCRLFKAPYQHMLVSFSGALQDSNEFFKIENVERREKPAIDISDKEDKEENIGPSTKGTIDIFNDMNKKLSGFIKAFYDLKNDRYELKKDNPISLFDYQLRLQKNLYPNSFELTEAFDKIIRDIPGCEEFKGEKDLNELVQFCMQFVGKLKQLKTNKNQAAIDGILKSLSMWNDYRLKNLDKDLCIELDRVLRSQLSTKDTIDCNALNRKPAVNFDLLKKLASKGSQLKNIKKLGDVEKIGTDNSWVGQYLGSGNTTDIWIIDLMNSVRGYNDPNEGDSIDGYYEDIFKYLRALVERFYCQWVAKKIQNDKNIILSLISSFEAFLKTDKLRWKAQDNGAAHQADIDNLKSFFN